MAAPPERTLDVPALGGRVRVRAVLPEQRREIDALATRPDGTYELVTAVILGFSKAFVEPQLTVDDAFELHDRLSAETAVWIANEIASLSVAYWATIRKGR